MRVSGIALAICFWAVLSMSVVAGQTPPPTFGIPNTNPRAPITSPIQVEACITPETGGILLARSTGDFKITFTNEGSITADLIRFEVQVNQEDVFIHDVGKFTPGVTVTHVFKRRGGNDVVSSPLFHPVDFTCRVASAHFVDGTDWTPPQPTAQTLPPTRARTAAQMPIRVSGNGYIGAQLAQTDAGVVVHLVFPNGPADAGGLRQGDLILQIARQRVASIVDAATLVSETPPGTALPFTVIRDGAQQAILLIVAKRPVGEEAQ